MAAGSEPPSVRAGIRLCVRAVSGLPVARTCTGEDSPFHPFSSVSVSAVPTRVPSVGSLPVALSPAERPPYGGRSDDLSRSGFAHLIGRDEGSRCCSSADGLPPRVCTRSPARTVGGLSSCPLAAFGHDRTGRLGHGDRPPAAGRSYSAWRIKGFDRTGGRRRASLEGLFDLLEELLWGQGTREFPVRPVDVDLRDATNAELLGEFHELL